MTELGTTPDNLGATKEPIGILFAGEMGAAIGTLLQNRGTPVITTLEGRGAATARRCHEAGFTILGSVAEVVARAEMVWSFVPPDCAGEVADLVVAAHETNVAAGRQRLLYIDGNSVSPGVVAQIGERLNRAGISFVDASIHGDAGRLRERSVLYVSGPEADRVEATLRGSMRMRNFGAEPGTASRFKMTIAGVSKGLSALFMEVATFASEQDLLEPWIEECRHFYPEIIGSLDRMLPTYARHAPRRAAELKDMERTIRDLGLEPGLITASQQLVEHLASHSGDEKLERCARTSTSLEEFLSAVSGVQLLGRGNRFRPSPPSETVPEGQDRGAQR